MHPFLEKNKRYLKMIKPYLKYEYKILFLLLIGSVIGLSSSLLFQIIIDRVLLLKQMYLLKYVLIALFLSYFLGMLISFVTGYLSNYLGQIFSIKLRNKLMLHILNLKIEKVSESKVGDFMSKISDDVATITNFLAGTVISFSSDCFNLLSTGMLMLFFNVKLSIITLIMCLVQVYASKKYAKITRENQRDVRNNASLNLSFLNNTFSSIKYIKSFQKEKYTQRNYITVLRKLKDLSFKTFFIQYMYGFTMSAVSYIGSIVILVIGVFEIQKGNMSIGMLFVFDNLTDNFCKLSNNIVGLNVTVQSVIVAFERINSIFDLEDEVYDKKISLKSFDIQFKDVEFAYKEKNILDKINFEILEGKSYALIGSSGSGKSTICSLLLHFYENQSGSILIGGRNINDIGILELRNKITLVLQDDMIINGTIEDNIRFGNESVSIDKVYEVSKIAGIHEFIESTPNKYNTYIQEDGENLSGGQKQRICLARALLRDGKIFIFDESFSGLDSETETKVFDNIESYLKGKTRIYITHNEALVDRIETVFELKDGKVICR